MRGLLFAASCVSCQHLQLLCMVRQPAVLVLCTCVCLTCCCLLFLIAGKLPLHVRMDVQQHLLQLAQDQLRHDGKSGGSSKAAASHAHSAEEVSEAADVCWRHSLRVLLSSPIEPWQHKNTKQQSSLPGSSSLLGSGGYSQPPPLPQQQHLQQHAGGSHHHWGAAKHAGSSRAHVHRENHHTNRGHGSHAHGHKGSSRAVAAAAAAAAAAAGDMSAAAAQAAAAAGMFGPGMAGFPVLQGFPAAALLPNLAGLQALGAWPQGLAAAAAVQQQQQGWPSDLQQAAMQQLQEQQLQQLASGQLGMPLGGPMAAAAAAAAAAAMQRQQSLQQDQQQRQQQQQGGLSLPVGMQGMLGALPGSGADLYSQQMQAMAALSSQPMAWAAAGLGEATARMN
jgi:hypothetical protein